MGSLCLLVLGFEIGFWNPGGSLFFRLGILVHDLNYRALFSIGEI